MKQIEQTNIKNLKIPAAPDLEQAVLGAMLIDKNAADLVFDIIRAPVVFFLEKHQHIAKAISDLYSENHPIDILTVSERLSAGKILGEIGGDAYLIDLAAKVGSAAHCEYHSRIIMQMFLKREILKFNHSMAELATDPATDVFELLEGWQNRFDAVIDYTLTGRRTLSFAEALKKVREDAIRLSETDGPVAMSGVPTGFYQLDRLTGGYKEGDLIILAARPGMGKTAKVLKTAGGMPEKGIPVGFISLEMSIKQLTARMVSINSNLHLAQIMKDGFAKKKYLEQYDQTAAILNDWPIYIDESGIGDITEIQIRAKAWKRRHNIGLLVVDYLQLMEDKTVGRGGNRESIISSCSRKLKLLAKQLQIPIIALSQLSRKVEERTDKRPRLSDLRESGAIEQDADIVEFVFRPGYYDLRLNANQYDNTDHRNMVENDVVDSEIIVEKHRGGSRGYALLKWIGSKTKFWDPISKDSLKTKPDPETVDDIPF